MKLKLINLMTLGALAWTVVSCSTYYDEHLSGAVAGNPDDQYAIGTCFFDGDGGVPGDKVNKAQAVEWFTKAAQQGNVKAQNKLGIMYEEGDGVPQNDELAVQWYKRAALQGYSKAQYNLGHFYDFNDKSGGFDVGSEEHKKYNRLREEAAKWYRMAAVQGDADAQNRLGMIYIYASDRLGGLTVNLGGNPNDLRAYWNEGVEWLRKAAAKGNQRHIDNYQSVIKNGFKG